MARMLLLLVAAWLLPAAAPAEVVSASDTHYTLRHEAESDLSPGRLWQRLIEPASWWHPDHTYSGKSENLSLRASAGGLWREDWDGGSVSHGRVLLVRHGKLLRLEAPFGPLQEQGVHAIWTITVSAREGGSTVVFDEVANGPPTASLREMARAVDGVKAEAIRRLTAPE